ncbi:MAG: nuclear transport factor 2 family protein, partial [Acidobacteriota bacterium]|nr:nuclear transport factor 2 family protein [Acidobacteriota bacterium]
MRRSLAITLLVIASAVTILGAQVINRHTKFSERRGDMSTDEADQPPAEQSLLLRLEREWNEALRTRDVAWFERNLAGDVTDISSGNGALHTKTEDIAALKADKTVYESLELSDLKARVEGSAGIVTGVNHIKGHDDQGQAFDVRLSFTDTYIKR